MKHWKPCLVAQMLILVFISRCVISQTVDNHLVTHAQTLNDLRYVLGPNYMLFIAGYWRYLTLSCEIFSAKMVEEFGTGRLEKYCMFMTRCPMLHNTQSCMIQISVFSIRFACCLERTEPVTTTPRPFNLEDQRTCNYRRFYASGKIYGGVEVNQGEIPFQAMVTRNGRLVCSGVVLDARHILTAAHCLSPNSTINLNVIAGKHNNGPGVIDSTEQRREVKTIITHKDYNNDTFGNDIAVLVLVTPLDFTDSVMPACLPSATDTLEPLCTVSGWGKTQVSEQSSVLMKVELQTYTKAQCSDEFNNTANNLQKFLHDGVICAANGQLGQKDSCTGDSGGPLMCLKSTRNSSAWFVFGMVSNGNNCAIAGEPGIYMSIQYYMDWINTVINSYS